MYVLREAGLLTMMQCSSNSSVKISTLPLQDEISWNNLRRIVGCMATDSSVFDDDDNNVS